MFKDKMIAAKNKIQAAPAKVKETYLEHREDIGPVLGLIVTQVATTVVLSVISVVVSRGANSVLDSFCDGLESPDTIEVD